MYLEKTDLKEIINVINTMKLKNDDVVLMMFGEKKTPDINKLILELNKKKINFFGGIFPGIIYKDKKYEEGVIINVLPSLAKPFLIKGLNTVNIKIPYFGEQILTQHEKKYTAFVFVDGLTSNISLFISELFNRLGNSVHYFGSGAGSLSLKQSPCLFTSEGFTQDAAIVTFIKLESLLGVQHGWKRLMGPFVATRTNKNIIIELNWGNAFDIYKKTIEEDSGKKITKNNFFSIAKEYPFGIYKEKAEFIVRDPIKVNAKGEIICVGEVPENTVLCILKGENSSLIQAAGKAADDCKDCKNKKIHQAIIIDCISRTLFLGDDFASELKIIQEKFASICKFVNPEGVLSLGEISSYGEEFVEFFNKTIVVGIFYE